MTYELRSGSAGQTQAIGAALARCLRPGDVVAMRGDLGAGKTVLVRGALEELGYGNVSSPTFAIMNEYRGGAADAVHMDAYRISGEDELYGTGFYDYLDGKNVIFIEWSENIPFAVDEDGSLGAILNASTVLPQTVIVDPDGVVIYNQVGALDYETLCSLVDGD